MSYALRVRETLAALPRPDRLALVPKLWGDALAGRLSDLEAEELVELAQGGAPEGPAPALRRPLMRVPKRPTPRSPDREKSIQRRRATAMSGAVPAKIAAVFTTGETAVLAVIARQVQRLGACTLCIDAIAAMAGVCRRLAQQAMRKAETAGLIRIEERKVRAYRHMPHRITIASAEWAAWLRLSPKQGCRKLHPTDNQHISSSGKASGSGQKRPALPAEEHRNSRGGKGGGSPPPASR